MWSTETEKLALELLERLEAREHELLTWGFLDGGFMREEVEQLAQEIIDASDGFLPPEDLIAILQDRALLFDFNFEGRHLYRSRFAEAVRLFARLRQIFKPSAWNISPSLVADYRLAVRPRRYPKRDVPPAEVQNAVATAIAPRPLYSLEKGALKALTQRNSTPILLSRFQVQAAVRLLAPNRDNRSQGTIVCAGTGTGKTIAFYLPALLHIARVMEKEEFWTQAVALYPRNELLKDQFTEAYGQARRLDAVVKKAKGRKIRIGAYFGPTPYKADVQSVEWAWGEKSKISGGYVCPFLRCPECDGEMMWRLEDIRAGRERLRCTQSTCSGATAEDEVLLTRQRLQKEPPDILFTTTEMLNRSMSSTWLRPVFGVDHPRERAPQFVLLDEVHTYGGVHGAQVALLLRRYRHEVKHPLHFVGLSATLADPQSFFSDLTGLSFGAILPVMPSDDMEEEGKEYQLVLRGDPVSGTSLLSTSIQAAMLLARVLDPLARGDAGPTGDLFGRKVFVFTDDLDVTNRLYHNLLDAEGRDSWGRVKSNKEPLAALRASSANEPGARLRDGQNWKLCEEIGHALQAPNHRLEVGRTSSQDAGVDGGKSVVVATASLEVGYNDPRVGAVIQHKAPRDAASFLQRKGRAGRQRITRPWTVVVLSDYGRDRIAYQGYDQLFDPVLDKPSLPVDNRYVLRIQAVYAFMDWMVSQSPKYLRSNVWSDFTRPARADDEWGQKRQAWQAQFIRQLLETGQKRDDLANHLRRALRISDDDVKALLWEPPRALMTAVLPTLWRRLITGWRQLQIEAGENEFDLMAQNAPLPDFVTENLFSDLSVPEVRVLAPRGVGKNAAHLPPPEPEENWMSLTPALRALAPGRATRRFAVRHIADSHWVEPPLLTESQQQMPVGKICCRHEEVGTFQTIVGEEVADVRCVRPLEVLLQLVPENVRNTSNAFLQWRSQFLPPARGEVADVPQGSAFGEWVRGVTFFTHNQRNPLRVRRFAVASDAALRFKNGDEAYLHIAFTDEDGEPAALGFEQEVDGLLFRCHFSDELLEDVKARSLRALRAAFFRDLVESDVTLLQLTNSFRLTWLSQVFLSILLARAMVSQNSLAQAAEYYRNGDPNKIWLPAIERALDVIFGVLAVAEDEDGRTDLDDDAQPASADRKPRLYASLRELAQEVKVRERLLDLARVLWEAPQDFGSDKWDEWLRRRLKATLGGALLQACYALTPQFQTGDLLLDLGSGAPAPEAPHPWNAEEETIWISEDVMGGAGVVEEIMRQYIEDPRRFFLLVETALGPSDFEIVDAQLSLIVELSQSDAEVQGTFDEVRTLQGNNELSLARRALMGVLSERNVLLTHPVMTSLNARVLRAGSGASSDELLAALLRRWNDEENKLGLEIDARIFAYLAAVDDEFKPLLGCVLSEVGGEDSVHLKQRYSLLYGLLWPRGAVLRERTFESYNPYVTAPKGDASLLMEILRVKRQPVSLHDRDWSERAAAALAENGLVQIVTDSQGQEALRAAILELVSQPIEVGFLRLYPHLARLESTLDGFAATLHLQEAIQ